MKEIEGLDVQSQNIISELNSVDFLKEAFNYISLSIMRRAGDNPYIQTHILFSEVYKYLFQLRKKINIQDQD